MKAPKCRLCGESHWGNQPHKWETTSNEGSAGVVEVLREKIKSVHNPKKRVHNDEKPEDMCTQVRQIGIRKFRANLSEELRDLPFEIVKNGVVIARVVGV